MSSDQHSPIATVVVDDEEQQTDDRISPPFAEFVAHVDDKTLRYNKDVMLKLAQSVHSQQRPDYLSRDFNDEHSMWSPELWLEHLWQCEGLETRNSLMMKKKMDKHLSSNMDNNGGGGSSSDGMVLSPQRRGFATGCRPSSPSKFYDTFEKVDRIGADKRNWRAGAAGFGGNRCSNGNEYKQTYSSKSGETTIGVGFARRGAINSQTRRGASQTIGEDSTSFQPSFNRQHNLPSQQQRRNTNYERRSEERMPEWTQSSEEKRLPEWMFDGPVTHLDTIELRGFDEDSGNDKQDDRTSKRNKGSQQQHEPTKQMNGLSRQQLQAMASSSSGNDRHKNNSRPTSRPSSNENQQQSAIGERVSPKLSVGSQSANINLPQISSGFQQSASDIEFAAMFGLLDNISLTQDNGLLPSARASNADGGSSRFSKFFSTPNFVPSPSTTLSSTLVNDATEHNNANRIRNVSPSTPNTMQQQKQAPPSSGVLENLFSNSSRSANTMHPSAPPTKAMTLEELERSMRNSNDNQPPPRSDTNQYSSYTAAAAQQNSKMREMPPSAPSSSFYTQQPQRHSSTMLQELFANAPPYQPGGGGGIRLPSTTQQTNPIKTMMTLEELEGSIRKENATKSQQQNPEAFGGGDQQRFVFDNNHPMNSAANLTRQQLTNTQIAKGNPLGDPQQQANFLNKLSRLERMQWSAPTVNPHDDNKKRIAAQQQYAAAIAAMSVGLPMGAWQQQQPQQLHQQMQMHHQQHPSNVHMSPAASSSSSNSSVFAPAPPNIAVAQAAAAYGAQALMQQQQQAIQQQMSHLHNAMMRGDPGAMQTIRAQMLQQNQQQQQALNHALHNAVMRGDAGAVQALRARMSMHPQQQQQQQPISPQQLMMQHQQQ